MPGTVPSAGDAAVNEAHSVPASQLKVVGGDRQAPGQFQSRNLSAIIRESMAQLRKTLLKFALKVV